MQKHPHKDFLLSCLLSDMKNLRKVRNFLELLHFNLLRNSHPAVSTYTDGCELLASGAFLMSGSVSKTSFFDALPPRAA